jgi:hypothetical protein
VRVFWRRDLPLHSHAEWRGKLGKNSKQGTSAPTLAAAWAGPVEVMGALRHQPALEGLVLTEIAAEVQSPVDEHSGDRNHDLVIVGELPNGETVCICVEAKVKESFGPTVAQQAKAAAETKKQHPTSNQDARLKGLLERFVWHPHTEERVHKMRYQLLTALAGTLSEAEHRKAQHAVLFLHEFLTDKGGDEKVLDKHHTDLHRFMTTVLDCEPPSMEGGPWSMDVSGATWAPDIKLYIARAATDLRTTTLEAGLPPKKKPAARKTD